MKGSKGEINEKTWQRKRTRDKRLYEVNKWTAKTKENEKKKEEVLKKERKVNPENINKMNIKMGTWNVRRLKGKE
jgi:hypothetical protein